ncbi:MAG: hypothetical protein WB424_05735, partial [Terracidiphilus sp.]
MRHTLSERLTAFTQLGSEMFQTHSATYFFDMILRKKLRLPSHTCCSEMQLHKYRMLRLEAEC